MVRAMLEVAVARCGEVVVPLPEYKTSGSAGMDLHAALLTPLVIVDSSQLASALPSLQVTRDKCVRDRAWRCGTA